jgi:hypothetical protein
MYSPSMISVSLTIVSSASKEGDSSLLVRVKFTLHRKVMLFL